MEAGTQRGMSSQGVRRNGPVKLRLTGKTATALLESLQDDYIGTREEEHSRTTVDGRVPSTSSSNPERTPAEESTPTQPPTPSAITTPQRVVLGKRKRGSGPAGTAP
ncbi:hypothetical protein CgunFtcFv8_021996 [Champsocephalus gunnari]|uniref:Uncharacterized protein n=1 Tax=Champsocephalus gunnari TaxID=52237 RepID=A0AAN8HSQ4_CHAGU|nr:hypothetical protein CgunFtcFv8_021996 [Champsocephalus gunnari]